MIVALDKRKTHRKVAGNNNSMRLGVMNKFITVTGLLYHTRHRLKKKRNISVNKRKMPSRIRTNKGSDSFILRFSISFLCDFDFCVQIKTP